MWSAPGAAAAAAMASARDEGIRRGVEENVIACIGEAAAT